MSLSGRYGFIDKSGKEIIGLDYDFADVFIGGLARVNKNDRWMYIDTKGRTVWPGKTGEVRTQVHRDVSIRYSMAGLKEISIVKGRLRDLDSEYRGPNPQAAGNPDDSVRTQTETPVTEAEVQALFKAVLAAGFLDLDDTC